MSSEIDLQLGDDLARFYSDPLGFVKYAYPWRQPGLLENHDGPDLWQEQLLVELGEQVRRRAFDGLHPVPPIRLCVVSGHGVGKSVLCAWITHWIMSTRPRARGTVSANTYLQLDTKTWAAIQAWARLLINRHWFVVTADSMYFRGAKDSWRVTAQSCKEENSEAFAGQHAADSCGSTSWMKHLRYLTKFGKFVKAAWWTANPSLSLAETRPVPLANSSA